MNEKEVVLAFWKAMESNDFAYASEFLSEDFEGYWPQSSELIAGRECFAAVNTHYPAEGIWIFSIQSIVHEESQVVTDVKITDGKLKARAITFHTVIDGLIKKQVEFWPDDYEAPEWRKQWVKHISPDEMQVGM